MDEGVGFLLIVFVCIAVAVLAGLTGYGAGRNAVLREACEARGKAWAEIDGEYKCVTVTP